jgi:RNA polymerase sigma factor (sigma-70 family)
MTQPDDPAHSAPRGAPTALGDRELAAGIGAAPMSSEQRRAARAAADRAAGEYLQRLRTRPRLGDEDERELVCAARAGDPGARERLIETFLPLISATARVYRGSRQIERIELLQEGVVGLLRALERYDPERGVPFWAYASWWVRQAMQQLVAELTRPTVLSDRALRQLARMKDAHRGYVQRHGREPTVHELAQASDVSPEQIADLIAVERPALALEQSLQGAGERDGEIGTFGELLADPLAEGEYERALAEIEIQQLRRLLAGLSERERAVLRARYGLGQQEQTLREIGARLGLSAERVRQIEQRALGKLRAGLEG